MTKPIEVDPGFVPITESIKQGEIACKILLDSFKQIKEAAEELRKSMKYPFKINP